MSQSTIDPTEEFAKLFKMEKYRNRIAQLAIANAKSIVVDFIDVIRLNIDLTSQLLERPEEYLGYLASLAYDQLSFEDPAYYEKITKEQLKIRIANLEETAPLRTLSSEDLGKLVMVDGVIVGSTPVNPTVKLAAFQCKRCGTINKIQQETPFLQTPKICQDPDCGRDGPFNFLTKESTFIDCQELRMQEPPEDLPPGQVPLTLDIRLIGKDLVEHAHPGDHARIVGILYATPKNLMGVGKLCEHTKVLEANFVDVLEKDNSALQPNTDEKAKIEALAKDPEIHKKIMQSLAPSISGHDEVKEGLAYAQFGGVTRTLPDMTTRGESNILIIGDPGIAKTQMLLHMAKIAPRGIYAQGKGVTAVGLTAAVTQDKKGTFQLQAGTLVLADKGVACIDELDKMEDYDRVAIHEALEQHTVTVSKGGIHAKLNARAAVIAACNPTMGRYDGQRPISENINLAPTLLSRFDLIFVLQDIPNKETDTEVATRILNLHRNQKQTAPVPTDLLRKYIAYAKNIEPILSEEAAAKLQEFYLAMRGAASNDSIPITPRQLEGLVRLAEAHAKMALRTTATVEDAKAAMQIMKKSLEQVGFDVDSGNFNIDLIMTGITKGTRDIMRVILDTVTQQDTPVPKSDIIDLVAKNHKLKPNDVEKCIMRLLKEGTLYEPQTGMIWRTR
jgi:replicative DNA helicase Mcm